MKTGMIFIDGSNVFYDWKTTNYGQNKLDIEKYINLIKTMYSNIDFKRTYYFTTESPENIGFLNAINNIPYCEVKRGRLQTKYIDLSKYNIDCDCGQKVIKTIETKVDKGTDVSIAVEMLKHAYSNSYDVAVLVSRDADFSSVVKIIKDLGKIVELVLFESRQTMAKELTDVVDNVTIIKNDECISIIS